MRCGMQDVIQLRTLRRTEAGVVEQVYYNKQAGTQKITTETGAGQWGSSLAFAGAAFGSPPRTASRHTA